MNEEVVKSNQMLEEEDEHGNLARDISKYLRIIFPSKYFPYWLIILDEVDMQIAMFGKTKELADKAAGFRAKREELRKAKEAANDDDDMSDSGSDEEIDWRQQNIF